MRRRRGAARRSRVALTVVIVLVLSGVDFVASLWNPPTDPEPEQVDAVVQLGGVVVDSYALARQLGERGVTPEVVLSNVGRDYPAQRAQLCAPATTYRVRCFDPDPADTRGEAREIGALAESDGWKSVYVVAADEAHVTRAEYIVSRCLPDDVRLDVGYHAVGRTHRERIKQWLYQTGGWAKALTQVGC